MTGRHNQAPPPNGRQRLTLGSLGGFEHPFYALPASSAAVGEAQRYASRV